MENIQAPTGSKLHCQGWVQEAAMRMLMNNLDAEVAENPSELIVYGGRGKAARSWKDYSSIIAALQKLSDEETLLVQSGRAVGVIDTHKDAPRVLIANSNLVGNWANWDHFWELEKKGLMMYGQMTAGSWIYIGSQGILQGTYETFAAVAKRDFAGSLKGKWILSGGLGGMGGAQPLAATMNDACFLGVDVDQASIEKRLKTRYLDVQVDTLDEALQLLQKNFKQNKSISIALCANAADIYSELVKRNITPDIVTDQTSAHDPLEGYVPNAMNYAAAIKLRESNPKDYVQRSYQTMGAQVEAMLTLKERGAVTFDYGNNIRGNAKDQAGVAKAFDIPGFVPEFIRPLFCEGKGPFRWVALSGDPNDITVTDRTILELFPEDEALSRWIRLAGERVQFQGLPARICWLGCGEREKAGLAFNELVRTGKVKAPLVIGRDHLDCGSVASPNRETEAMKDGSDAVGDWPILNALVNAVNGASWVSFHHGGGVGMGYSLHAGQVIVADGTEQAGARLARVLRADPGMGVIRHVDAGYDQANQVAKQRGVKIPGVTY